MPAGGFSGAGVVFGTVGSKITLRTVPSDPLIGSRASEAFRFATGSLASAVFASAVRMFAFPGRFATTNPAMIAAAITSATIRIVLTRIESGLAAFFGLFIFYSSKQQKLSPPEPASPAAMDILESTCLELAPLTRRCRPIEALQR